MIKILYTIYNKKTKLRNLTYPSPYIHFWGMEQELLIFIQSSQKSDSEELCLFSTSKLSYKMGRGNSDL
jgi:hypothetical protein